MKNTEIIRNKILSYRVGELINIGELYKKEFSYLTTNQAFIKNIERMTKKGVLLKVSKGIYSRPNITKYGILMPTIDDIINKYTNNETGMVVGYALYNNLNLSTQISKQTIIYSNSIQGETKTILNIKIIKVELKFDSEIRKTVEFLEVLSNFNNIQDLNKNAFIKLTKEFSLNYKEDILNKVLANIKYKKSTIAFLNNILNFYEVDNGLYNLLSSFSKYDYIPMEKIYEFA